MGKSLKQDPSSEVFEEEGMQRAGPLHPSVSLLLEFGWVFTLFGYFLDSYLCSKVFSPGLHDDDDDTRSGFDFRKLIFDSGRAGALPSRANVCKRPKTDFLRGASGSTRYTG